MIKRIMGFLLAIWGGGVLIKNLFFYPTIFTKINFHGFTPFMIGNVLALLTATIALLFGIKWILVKANKQSSTK